MAERTLRSTFSLKVGYEVFTGREEFVGGLLPTEREVRHFCSSHFSQFSIKVIEMMVYLMAKRKGEPRLPMAEAAKIVGQRLQDHWIWSNCYPKKLKNVQTQVENLYGELRDIQYLSNPKQKEQRLAPFLSRIQKRGMDIGTKDSAFLAKLEVDYGVKMTKEDYQYQHDQVKGPRKMYCQSFADKQWLARKEKRDRENERLARAREKDAASQASLFSKVIFIGSHLFSIFNAIRCHWQRKMEGLTVIPT